MSLKQRFSFNFFDVFVVTFCLLFGFICFYPMWYVFLGSLTPIDSVGDITPLLLPRGNISFRYYAAILSGAVFQRALMISFVKTLIGAVVTLIITGMMAYGISKKKVKGMTFLNITLIITVYFSGGLIPTYFLIKDLGMLNTIWVMVVPGFTSVGNFIIMRNYFSYNIPGELEDACTVDGANEIVMFFRIVIPISMPMFAAIFLFESVAQWNDWYSYLIYVDDPKLQPFIWVLRRLLVDPNLTFQSAGQSNKTVLDMPFMPPTSLKMTTIIVAMLPIIMLYPFLQKYFAQGIMIGAIKG